MKKPDTTASQSERFKQAARELGCDENEERFNAALKLVAKHRPKPTKKRSFDEGDQ